MAVEYCEHDYPMNSDCPFCELEEVRSSNCSNCKHWDENDNFTKYNDDGDDPKSIFNRCVCPEIHDASRMGFKELHELKDSVATVSDHEDYKADFYTGPNFGCIHHEPVDEG